MKNLFEKHVKTCTKKFCITPCEACGLMLDARDMDGLHSYVCPVRETDCASCGKVVRRDLMKAHLRDEHPVRPCAPLRYTLAPMIALRGTWYLSTTLRTDPIPMVAWQEIMPINMTYAKDNTGEPIAIASFEVSIQCPVNAKVRCTTHRTARGATPCPRWPQILATHTARDATPRR